MPIRDLGLARGLHGHTVDDGLVNLGDPAGDDERTRISSRPRASTRSGHVMARTWASAGLLRMGTVESWALWLDDQQRLVRQQPLEVCLQRSAK